MDDEFRTGWAAILADYDTAAATGSVNDVNVPPGSLGRMVVEEPGGDLAPRSRHYGVIG